MQPTGKTIGALLAGILLGVLLAQITIPQATPASPAGAQRTATVLAASTPGESGVAGSVTVSTVPGDGDVLVDTNPFLESDVQYSGVLAVQAAQHYSGASFAGVDVILDYQAPGVVVGGASAGAATAVALVALVENRSVREDVAITGTITPDGRIGRVGAIIEKAAAAAQEGDTLLLVPPGQTQVRYYERTGPFPFMSGYQVRVVDIREPVREELGIEVREVSTLAQAVEAMLE